MTSSDYSGKRTADTSRSAVLVVAHGDRGGAGHTTRNRALVTHTATLTHALAPIPVAAGVLKGTPSVEDALAKLHLENCDRLIVYPFFMADGYFVKKVLPERLKQARVNCAVQICTPLGLDAGLPDLIQKHAKEAAKQANRVASQSRLLLVGHGSKIGPASAEATRRVADAVAKASTDQFAEVDVAFLEEAPFLNDALRKANDPTLVSGFFNGDGLHAGEDVPNAISDTGAEAVYCGPIGSHPGIADLMAETIKRELSAR